MTTQTPDQLPKPPRIASIPPNRIVAFIAPRLIYFESAIAAWLVAKVNVLGIPGLDQANVATWIGAVVTAGLTATVTHLAHMKWLHGWIASQEIPEARATAVLVPDGSPDDAALHEDIDGPAGEDSSGPLEDPKQLHADTKYNPATAGEGMTPVDPTEGVTPPNS